MELLIPRCNNWPINDKMLRAKREDALGIAAIQNIIFKLRHTFVGRNFVQQNVR